MGKELLKKTGAGNLFTVFGEPDIAIYGTGDGQVEVEVHDRGAAGDARDRLGVRASKACAQTSMYSSHMKIGVRELRDTVSAVLERVERGETVTVTRHGRPIARLLPAGLPAGLEAMLARGDATWSGRRMQPPPTPIGLRGPGPGVTDYVREGRR